MQSHRKSRARSVEVRGSAAGSVVRGSAATNRGVRIRVLCEQAREPGGALRGAFVILDAGDNKHSPCLETLVGRVTDAREVVARLREAHPGCVSVANVNILEVEPPPAS